MPQTLASSTALLCPVDEFLKRVDQAAVAKLASNTTAPIDLAALPTDPNLLAAIRDAGGMFESTVSRGGRYSLDDIATILATDTNARGTLYRIITDLAWFFLFQRRPNKDAAAPPSFEYSMELMQQLGDGDKKVFPFLETEAAGVLELIEATVDDVEQRNTASYQARDFYGRRSDRDRGWRN